MNNINIKDVARLAGVGIGTVSRVINNHPDVKEETREHILKIIDKYNYIPNSSARYLKKTVSNDIGILIKGIHNPLFAKMVEVIETNVAKKSYRIVLHHQIEEDVNDIDIARAFVKEKRLKGLICLGGDFENMDSKVLMALKIPIVLTTKIKSQDLDDSLYSSVSINNVKSAYTAVSHLINLGHRKIGIISSGAGDQAIGAKRIQGYLEALSENEIEKIDHFFELSDFTFKSSYEATLRLLKKAPDISALFAISDVMALGAAKAIRDMGVKIPEQISVIGFDDIEFAEYFNPPLTTIKQPIVDMSIEMSSLMIDLIETETKHQHIEFETELISRSSTQMINP